MANAKTFPNYTPGDESPAMIFNDVGAAPLSPEFQLRRRMERQAKLRTDTQGGLEEKPAKDEAKPYKLR